jgi:hypothetical protein
MAQPQAARITCNQCNAWYNSESELRDHMRTAHRKFGSEQSSSQEGGTQPDSSKTRPREQQETPNREDGSG